VSEIASNEVLDVTGLTCPLPVLRLKQILRSMAVGEIVQVLATDKSTEHDIPSFCRQTGHKMLEMTLRDDGSYLFFIGKSD